MYIAYSSLQNNDSTSQENTDDPITQLRYQAYQQACKKHREYITQIQKYIPGWYPKFDHNTKY